MTELNSYYRALVRKWEKEDPRDRWRYGLGKKPPDHIRNGPIKPEQLQPKSYRTPESTVEAFWYVVRLKDAKRLETWLDNHPLDRDYLLKLWNEKSE